jgi:hypothetical protein
VRVYVCGKYGDVQELFLNITVFDGTNGDMDELLVHISVKYGDVQELLLNIAVFYADLT